MDLLGKLVSVLAAGTMILSGTLEEAAPQHDADGLLFLVNRQYMVSDAFEPSDLVEAQVPGQVREMRTEAAAALEEMCAACLEETGALRVWCELPATGHRFPLTFDLRGEECSAPTTGIMVDEAACQAALQMLRGYFSKPEKIPSLFTELENVLQG